jgi:hypothetical protein
LKTGIVARRLWVEMALIFNQHVTGIVESVRRPASVKGMPKTGSPGPE